MDLNQSSVKKNFNKLELKYKSKITFVNNWNGDASKLKYQKEKKKKSNDSS